MSHEGSESRKKVAKEGHLMVSVFNSKYLSDCLVRHFVRQTHQVSRESLGLVKRECFGGMICMTETTEICLLVNMYGNSDEPRNIVHR